MSRKSTLLTYEEMIAVMEGHSSVVSVYAFSTNHWRLTEGLGWVTNATVERGVAEGRLVPEIQDGRELSGNYVLFHPSPAEGWLPVVRCEDCGKPYTEFPLDMVIPDDQWEAIMPGRDGGGILCAQCIVERLSLLPGVSVVKAKAE